MITIIDYGLGNIKAFSNVYKMLDIPVCVATNKEELKKASKIILPGVGAFDHAMTLLNNSGMRQTLDELVLEKKIPVIGICVGMQILSHSSEEGTEAGLGWIDSSVKKIDSTKLTYKTQLPHMGWNNVYPSKQSGLFEGLYEEARFYFLHSFYISCNSDENSLATCEYGSKFSCAVNRDNIYGVQFHPEKSHHFGNQLLKNFATNI